MANRSPYISDFTGIILGFILYTLILPLTETVPVYCALDLTSAEKVIFLYLFIISRISVKTFWMDDSNWRFHSTYETVDLTFDSDLDPGSEIHSGFQCFAAHKWIGWCH